MSDDYKNPFLSESIFTGGVVLGQAVWNSVIESNNRDRERARQKLAHVRSQNDTIAALNNHIREAYDTIDELKKAKRQIEADYKKENEELRNQLERERAAFKAEERSLLLKNVFSRAMAIASGAVRQAEKKMREDGKDPALLNELAPGVLTKFNTLTNKRYSVTKAELIFWTAFSKIALDSGAPLSDVQKEVPLDIDVSAFMPLKQRPLEVGGRFGTSSSETQL